MLNELFDLSRSLDRLGIQVTSWHRYLKECPRGGKTFFIDLDSSPDVASIRQIVDEERISLLRKYEKAAARVAMQEIPLLQFLEFGVVAIEGEWELGVFNGRLDIDPDDLLQSRQAGNGPF